MEGGKRRRVVRTLDFENGIVTNIRTRTRRRRQLRARVTREVGGGGRTPPREASPVLVAARDGSPVLLRRKRPRETGGRSLSRQEIPAPGSPVFKVTQSGARGETPRGSSSSDAHSYRIDEWTQESRRSADISSVESGRTGGDGSESFALDTKSDTDASSKSGDRRHWPDGEDRPETGEKPARRTHRKNSLPGRLQRILQKQASEKFLWQHQRHGDSASAVKLRVVDVWRRDLSFFVKCRRWPDAEATYLVVDGLWVPSAKRLREGSVVRLHPPWQKVRLEESAATVLLNVICMEILQETHETTPEKENLRASAPTQEFLSDRKLFLDSLFSSHVSGLLW